jgi:hypothetical protein
MADTTGSANLEIVQLANGRFSVLPEGETAPADAEGEFATQAEAEDWMYRRAQEADEANDLGILTPGGGQGVR